MGTRQVLAETRLVFAGMRDRLSGRDLAAASATMTYFGAIAVVPWLLYAVWSTTWWSSPDHAEARWRHLVALVPPQMGGRPAYEALVSAGAHLGLVGALVLAFPASFYGEGFRRACLAVVPGHDTWTGWRGRALLMPVAVLVPVLTWAMLPLADVLAGLAPDGGGGGTRDLLVRIVLGFLGLWLALALPVAWLFRVVGPRPLGVVVALAGALATTANLAGFLHGFQLFLSIPVDVGIPFGGLGLVGGVVAVGLWLFVLHTMLLLGWVFTLSVQQRVDLHRAGGRA